MSGTEDFVDWWRVASLSTPRAACKGHRLPGHPVCLVDLEAAQCGVFDDAHADLAGLLSTVKSEARFWVHAGAVGLGRSFQRPQASSVLCCIWRCLPLLGLVHKFLFNQCIEMQALYFLGKKKQVWK